MGILLITPLLLNRKYVVINKALIGIFSAIVFLIMQAIISSVNTKATYEFSTKNNNVIQNRLQLTLNDGYISMLVSRKCSNNRNYPSHLNGVFLRFQNHYYVFGIEHIDENNSQLTFNDFFIDSLRSGEAIYISHSPSFSCLNNDFSEILLGKRIVN